jgi:hypothetical protein
MKEKYESRLRVRSEEPIDVNALARVGSKFGRVAETSCDRVWDYGFDNEDDE